MGHCSATVLHNSPRASESVVDRPESRICDHAGLNGMIGIIPHTNQYPLGKTDLEHRYVSSKLSERWRPLQTSLDQGTRATATSTKQNASKAPRLRQAPPDRLHSQILFSFELLQHKWLALVPKLNTQDLTGRYETRRRGRAFR